MKRSIAPAALAAIVASALGTPTWLTETPLPSTTANPNLPRAPKGEVKYRTTGQSNAGMPYRVHRG